jgi:tRNA (guanosine-2'-O-)-methyltransferase
MPCGNYLVVAPLWVSYVANLGTLLRTCDAVGACMGVPDTDHYRDSLKKGDTLAVRPCIHWVDSKMKWLDRQQSRGARILGVELNEDATPLKELATASQRTVVLLGHEHTGIPVEAWPFMDQVVAIPMMGIGGSLNVAVAGSLVLYKLAGLS